MATEVDSHSLVKPYKAVDLLYKGHTVNTVLNYYKDPGDGSAPMPVMVGR
jgi:hypothetical protein